MAVAGKSQEIAVKVCNKMGHNLVSYPLMPVFDPAIRAFIPNSETRCSRCTMTVPEIATFRYRAGGKAQTGDEGESAGGA